MTSFAIQAASLSHRYGNQSALSSVDLGIPTGQLTALLGPNGAGKSTLIHLLLGLLPIQQGRLEIFGESPRTHVARGRCGAMLQISGVQDNLRVVELLRLFASLYPDPERLDVVIDDALLSGMEQTFFGRLSGGQKQRVLFALALVGNPQLLILDEPTTGLDPAARQHLWQVIERRRQQGTTILLCTHYLDEAERLADQVVVLNHGEVLTTGTPDDIRRRVPNSVIRARTSLTAEQVSLFEQVLTVTDQDGRLEVLTAVAPATLREWLQADSGLEDLEVSTADLETAFLSLTSNTSDSLQEPVR